MASGKAPSSVHGNARSSEHAPLSSFAQQAGHGGQQEDAWGEIGHVLEPDDSAADEDEDEIYSPAVSVTVDTTVPWPPEPDPRSSKRSCGPRRISRYTATVTTAPSCARVLSVLGSLLS